MSDGTSGSPFDLEEEAAAAAPVPVKARRERRPRKRDARPPAAEAGPSVGLGAFFWGLFTSPRVYYALTSVLTIVLLFVLYNPDFGLQAGVWFWEALQGKGHAYAHTWNPTLLQAAVLPILALAFAAAALSGEREGRAAWAAFWVFAAFVTFQIARGELRFFLPPILGAAAIGLVLRRGRGDRARQATWILVIVLGAFLWLPLPEGQASSDATDFDTDGYKCTAIGLVDLMVDGPGAEDDGALVRRAKLLLLETPQYFSLVAWILLVAVALGARRRWLGWTGGTLLLLFLIGVSWVQFDIGSARTEGAEGPGPDWWAGARQIGDAWRARFVVFLPALAAICADLGRRRPDPD